MYKKRIKPFHHQSAIFFFESLVVNKKRVEDAGISCEITGEMFIVLCSLLYKDERVYKSPTDFFLKKKENKRMRWIWILVVE